MPPQDLRRVLPGFLQRHDRTRCRAFPPCPKSVPQPAVDRRPVVLHDLLLVRELDCCLADGLPLGHSPNIRLWVSKAIVAQSGCGMAVPLFSLGTRAAMPLLPCPGFMSRAELCPATVGLPLAGEMKVEGVAKTCRRSRSTRVTPGTPARTAGMMASSPSSPPPQTR